MAAQTYSIDFDGYWREPNMTGIPEKSGVYCVYECTRNVDKKNVTIHRLIYIGESKDVYDRIANHEKHTDWMKYVRKGNVLCFSFGPVKSDDRDRCEAALIFKHKPPVNTEFKDSFPSHKTTMKLSGEIRFLEPNFTVGS